MARPRRFLAVSATPVLDTSAYQSGDSLHTADLTFENVVDTAGGSGLLVGLVIIDKANQAISTELWIFDAPLANTTHTANAAWNLADADAGSFVGLLKSGTWYASSNNAVTTRDWQEQPFQCAPGSRNLYGVLVTRGTPTYAADSLVVKLQIDQGD